MNDHPKVRVMKRGGEYRRCYMVQPYIHQRCYDVYRVAYMEVRHG